MVSKVLNPAYQKYLEFLRSSTSEVSCSWATSYKGQTIYGATYNGRLVCHTELNGKTVYSKSIKVLQNLIRTQGVKP
jgi:hypothetical protein